MQILGMGWLYTFKCLCYTVGKPPSPVNNFDTTTIKSTYLFYMYAYTKSSSNECIVLLRDVEHILHLS